MARGGAEVMDPRLGDEQVPVDGGVTSSAEKRDDRVDEGRVGGGGGGAHG